MMHDLFESEAGSGWGILLVDAFNSVNREAALWNARILCPDVLDFCLIPTEATHC